MQRLQMKKANVARRAMNNLPCVSSELSRLIGYKTDTRAHTYGFIRENSDELYAWKAQNTRRICARLYIIRNNLYDFQGQILYILIIIL